MRKKILVTGGSGMLGCALKGVLSEAIYLSSRDADLRITSEVNKIFQLHKPDTVIHLASRVGGIKANMEHMGEFYHDNIIMNTNVLEACRKFDVKKVISALSTCIYPDAANYPLTENQIHNGVPHHSNFAYAYAKRMLDIQSRAYRKQYGCNFVTLVPNNLFGKYDNFNLQNSHVLAAMVRKIYEAKNNNEDVVFWGDGTALREFTYSEDMAKIIIFLLENYDSPEPINVGDTTEYSIKHVANMISKIYGFKGNIIWDPAGPAGQFRKPSDNSKLLELGWKKDNFSDFEQSLKEVCSWFEDSYPNVRMKA